MTSEQHNHQYPDEALEFRFVHASGPGGQHVNKASTAVELRVNIAALGLPQDIARRLRVQQKNRINKHDELIIHADQFRSQLQNRKDAVARLTRVIDDARKRPKRRIATRPSNATKRRRVDNKKIRGQTKSNRRKPSLD